MIKRILVAGILCLLLVLCLVTPLYAHVFTTDGSIEMGLHIEPADQPGAGETSFIHFGFTDADKKLDLTQCNCKISIENDNKIIFSESIANNPHITVKKEKVSLEYIFKTVGIYVVTIEGEPFTPHAFQSFKLSEDVRVEREASQQNHFLHSTHTFHALVYGIGLTAACIMIFKKRDDDN